jgi:uncharacterized protein (TIGR02145 family)
MAPTDYRFKNWTATSNGVTFADANSAATTFSMPANPVTVTANFEAVYFTDSRNSKKYRTVRIGTQTWMAENLNYQPSSGNAWCYATNVDSCTKYGRLYNWATAMNISASYDSVAWEGSDINRQGICPSGWHLPSNAEWNALVNYAGGFSTAGTKLKSSSGWNNYICASENGTDDFGFSALPGGHHFSYGYMDPAGIYGYWWTATDGGSNGAHGRNMQCDFGGVWYNIYYKSLGFSVRCVKDE